MARARRPRPRVAVVVEHPGHDVVALTLFPKTGALIGIIVRYAEAAQDKKGAFEQLISAAWTERGMRARKTTVS